MANSAPSIVSYVGGAHWLEMLARNGNFSLFFLNMKFSKSDPFSRMSLNASRIVSGKRRKMAE